MNLSHSCTCSGFLVNRVLGVIQPSTSTTSIAQSVGNDITLKANVHGCVSFTANHILRSLVGFVTLFNDFPQKQVTAPHVEAVASWIVIQLSGQVSSPVASDARPNGGHADGFTRV